MLTTFPLHYGDLEDHLSRPDINPTLLFETLLAGNPPTQHRQRDPSEDENTENKGNGRRMDVVIRSPWKLSVRIASLWSVLDELEDLPESDPSFAPLWLPAIPPSAFDSSDLSERCYRYSRRRLLDIGGVWRSGDWGSNKFYSEVRLTIYSFHLLLALTWASPSVSCRNVKTIPTLLQATFFHRTDQQFE